MDARIKEMKTETLVNKGGDPSIVIMKGHVTKEEFKQGFLNEGYDHAEECGENLRHEYGTWFGKRFVHRKYKDPLLEPYTIEDWD